MAKNKTEIHVTTVFDGELDATDVFVSLISQKYSKTNTKEYLAKKKEQSIAAIIILSARIVNSSFKMDFTSYKIFSFLLGYLILKVTSWSSLFIVITSV